MYKVPCGPTAYFDVDDTLVMWEIPEGFQEDLVTVVCRDYAELLAPNKHNIKLLKKMAARGHSVIVWSAGGADWAEAVVKALELEDYVHVVTGKPTYWIDDLQNPKDVLGKHGYFDINGNKYGHQTNFNHEEHEKEKE